MLRKSVRWYWLTTLLLAMQGIPIAPGSAGEAPAVDASSVALIMFHPGVSDDAVYALEGRACRRYGVVWSGGVALRRPDPVSPRPLRSRWQGAGVDRIRCADGGAFSKPRVADQPWIR